MSALTGHGTPIVTVWSFQDGRHDPWPDIRIIHETPTSVVLGGNGTLISSEFDALLSLIPAAFFKIIGYTAAASLLGGALTGFAEPPPEDTAKWNWHWGGRDRWHGSRYPH